MEMTLMTQLLHLEAGLGWITKFTKDFTDSEFLKKQKEEGVSRKLVAFEMIDRGIPRHDYPIKNAGGNDWKSNFRNNVAFYENWNWAWLCYS
jgi:glycine cleavage system aminomethyltransferase T